MTIKIIFTKIINIGRGRGHGVKMAAVENDIKYTVLYKRLPLWMHGYILPFIILYVGMLVGWILVFENFDHFEAFMISIGTAATFNTITCLSCVWSVHVRCLLTYRQVNSIVGATSVKVVPTPNNGSTEVVKLQRTIVRIILCSVY